jgi:hypothetical protein
MSIHLSGFVKRWVTGIRRRLSSGRRDGCGLHSHPVWRRRPLAAILIPAGAGRAAPQPAASSNTARWRPPRVCTTCRWSSRASGGLAIPVPLALRRIDQVPPGARRPTEQRRDFFLPPRPGSRAGSARARSPPAAPRAGLTLWLGQCPASSRRCSLVGPGFSPGGLGHSNSCHRRSPLPTPFACTSGVILILTSHLYRMAQLFD